MRQHVKDLGEKNYPKAVGEGALEITIAFVPIEGALSAALGFDGALQTYAFDRKIVFASPNKHTIEVRTLPVWMDAAPIVDAAHLFAGLFRTFVLGEAAIPAGPVDDAGLDAMIRALDLPSRAAGRWS